MAGKKGQITRAAAGRRESIYLSDIFGMWMAKNGRIHISMLKGKQDFHTSVSPKDGQLYDVMLMLYHHGLALNP